MKTSTQDPLMINTPAAVDAELVVGGVEDLGELQLVLRGNILK